MKMLIDGVRELAMKELARAVEIHGSDFHSDHECYAVLKEEIEETEDEVRLLGEELQRLWLDVKSDNSQNAQQKIKYMQIIAEKAAAELIQVVAMCQKATKK